MTGRGKYPRTEEIRNKSRVAQLKAWTPARRAAKSRAGNPFWKGGRTMSSGGYVVVLRPDHPRATTKGYVFEHILVVESKLGRNLEITEVVHHIDFDKTNNHPDNLRIMSPADHLELHRRERRKS